MEKTLEKTINFTNEDICRQLRIFKSQEAEIKQMIKELETVLKSRLESQGIDEYLSSGIKALHYLSRGTISYKKIVDELEFDDDYLEEYRSEPVLKWKISAV